MSRSNYSYAKRLKEIARQKKQEEKRLKKQAKAEGRQDGESQEPAEAEAGTFEEGRTKQNEPEAQ